MASSTVAASLETAGNRWIAVASADHVARARAGGFMQVCHGKGAPLEQIGAGDVVAYYSPARTFGGADRLQAFTAIGVVREGEPYRFDMGGGFCPFRRDVAWAEAHEAAIAPLLGALGFTKSLSNWGQFFRSGLFSVDARDFELIAAAMSADFTARPQQQRRATPTYGEPWGRLLRSTRLVGGGQAGQGYRHAMG
jgi:hypothetical protein